MANNSARIALEELRQTEPVAYFSKSENQFVLNIISTNKSENKIRTWVIKGKTAEKLSEDILSDYILEKIEGVKISLLRRAAGLSIRYKLDPSQGASKIFLLPDSLPLFITALNGAELDIAIGRLQTGS
jgi:hypothetical protein